MLRTVKSLALCALCLWLAGKAWQPYRQCRALYGLAAPLREVKKSFRDGDVVLVQPRRNVMEALKHTDLPVVAAPNGRYMDLSGFSRAWLVYPSLEPDIFAGGRATIHYGSLGCRNHLVQVEERRVAGSVVRLYENPHRGDLDAAAEMRVQLVPPDGAVKECERRGDGTFLCGPNDWNFVGLHEVTIQNARERCIWAHPQQAAVTRIRLPSGPAGGEVRLHTAIADSAAGDEGLPPVVLEVRSGDSVREVPHRPGKGFLNSAAPVQPGAPFTIDVATERESRQHFCFHIEW